MIRMVGQINHKMNCLECKKEFVPKRIDSKFCSRLCGTRFNRRQFYRRGRPAIQSQLDSIQEVIIDEKFHSKNIPRNDFVKYKVQHLGHDQHTLRVWFYLYRCETCKKTWFVSEPQSMKMSLVNWQKKSQYRNQLKKDKGEVIKNLEDDVDINTLVNRIHGLDE
jgi:transposase-like protein